MSEKDHDVRGNSSSLGAFVLELLRSLTLLSKVWRHCDCVRQMCLEALLVTATEVQRGADPKASNTTHIWN